MADSPLKIISTVDAVYNTLIKDIYSMRFQPGSRITENVLSDRYGVSRNTLREAIALLLSHGLLVKIPNKGVYVRDVGADDMREIFHLRELLEREAVIKVMENGVIPIKMFKLADRINIIDAENNCEEYIQADMAFHEELMLAAGSPRLFRLYEAIFLEIKLCVYRAHRVSPVNHENAITHKLLLEAMENNDREKALEILARHMDTAVNSYAMSL